MATNLTSSASLASKGLNTTTGAQVNSVASEEFTARQAEKRQEFNERMLKEEQERALQRQLYKLWCVELFEHTDGEVDLPWSLNYGVSEYVTKYHPYPMKIVGANEDGTGGRETPDYSAQRDVDVPATEELLRKIVKFARSKGYAVKKKYSDDDLKIVVTLRQMGEKPSYKDIVATYTASRKVVCAKVTKTVHHEEQVIEAHDEEVTEWECRKVSFLAVKDIEDTEN